MHNLNNFISISIGFAVVSNADPQRGMFTTNRTNTTKKVLGFLIGFFLFVSQKRGSSMLLQCVTQLACRYPVTDKNILKIYRITTVLKMDVLSNLSGSELSIDMAS